MFKLHRHRSDRFGEKVEFKLSNLQVLQVPREWNKLFLSIISVDSGRTIAKTGKATVRSGNCQWTETESIWVSQDESSKELEECQFKIVVAPVSSRSVTIGEVTLNMADHLSAGDTSLPLFLPLANCDFGTTLQVKIQCCAPNSNFRLGKSFKEETSHLEDQNNNDELESKSDGSDSMFNRTVASSSSKNLGSSNQDEPGNRDTNLTASGSQRISDSDDSFGPLGRTNFSTKTSLNGRPYVGKHDSSRSHSREPDCTGTGDELSKSNLSSMSSRAIGSSVRNNSQRQNMAAQASENGRTASLLKQSESSKAILEAAEEMEDLRDKAKIWEKHSHQLKHDIETLKRENSEISNHQINMDGQLAAAYNERDSLKLEVEQLKAALEESTSKQTNIGSSRKDNTVCVLELEDELKFQKETNADLTQQLRKTQESNIELVAILQELEEITEKQRLEIDDLSKQSCLDGQEGQQSSRKPLDNLAELEKETLSSGSHSDLVKEVETLKNKIQELERDCAELTEENLDLMYKLKESSKDTDNGTHSHSFRSKEFIDQTSSNNCEYEHGLLKSQIYELEDKLKMKEVMNEEASADLEKEKHYKDEASESFILSDMQNVIFEMDNQICLALAQAKDLHSRDSFDAGNQSANNVYSSTRSTTHLTHKEQVEDITRKLLELNSVLKDIFIYNSKSQHHNSGLSQRSFNDTEAQEQLKEKSFMAHDPEKLEKKNLLKEQEIERLMCSNKELEDLISNVQKEKCQVEEALASLQKENNEMSKILEDVELELEELTGSMEYHVSANKILEQRSVELESCKKDLEVHVSELEQENIQLSERISSLEAQIKYLTYDKESNRLELEEARSLVEYLKNEVEQQRGDMEMQKAETKRKLQEVQNQLYEALEESNVSRRSNSKLQATVESLTEECSSLDKLTGELKRRKLELHEHISHLEVELNETKRKNYDFCEQVDLLEIKLSSLQKDYASKEKTFLSRLERLFEDSKEHEERIGMTNVLLNKIEAEKTVEVQNLEKEIAHLAGQMSSHHDDHEKLALDAVQEASSLRSDKARLESTLQEVKSKSKFYETDFLRLQKESKDKIQGLVDLLNASKQSEEMLITEIDHLKRVSEGVKSSEEKHRKMVNDLELKHKAFHFEKQQLLEEISGLKVQLQKCSLLQNSVLDLTSSLDEANCDKRKVEELLKSVTEAHEALKSEKVTLTEKISSMQKALRDGEDDTHNRIALQEKVLRLESDQSVKEESCTNEAELKNELNRIKRTNCEYQRKVQNLEQENIELMKEIQAMKTGLRKSSQSKKVGAEVDEHPPDHIEVPRGNNEDTQSETSLETEHNNSLQESNRCAEQLRRVVSSHQTDDPEVLKKILKENSDKISSLETELKDMRERYLHMSLQYAEVEGEREELVMQLRSAKKEKGWFS